jgi:uncharacterized protein (DUF1330 family)
MTAAYVIADVKVSDPNQYREYMALTPAAVAAAGGEFVVRGGRQAVLEGHWSPSRLVVIRFQSFEAAQAFYDSALYLEARGKRAGATDHFNMIIVEGI